MHCGWSAPELAVVSAPVPQETPKASTAQSSPSAAPRPVLVAGVPRSSTTWVATVLAAACGEGGLIEPDNHHHQPVTMAAKRGLGSFPVLRPGDRAPLFEDLWRRVFVGDWPLNGDPAGVECERIVNGIDDAARDRMLLDPSERNDELFAAVERSVAAHRTPSARPAQSVVKSVQMCMALDWLAWLMPDVSIVVVERHPLDVVASWIAQGFDELGPLPDDWRECVPDAGALPSQPPESARLVERIAWKVGVLQSVQHADAARLGWCVLRHEDLLTDPERRLGELARELDLPNPPAAVMRTRESNRPGTGFAPNRVWEGLAGSARRRLDSSDAAAAIETLSGFGAAFGAYAPQ